MIGPTVCQQCEKESQWIMPSHRHQNGESCSYNCRATKYLCPECHDGFKTVSQLLAELEQSQVHEINGF
jgi:hypothetical protein